MAHASGEGEYCRRLVERGGDLISRAIREQKQALWRTYGAHVVDFYLKG
jgi:hypothetical protein